MNTFYASDRREWRRWLLENHRREAEIWFVFYKKKTGKPTLTYNDAVEEALCYGWIDSIERSLDDQRYALRFTPRRPTSKLSDTNRERLDRLVAQKKMTKAGLTAVAHLYQPKT